MPKSLQSILGGGNRVRKPSRPPASARPSSATNTPSSSPRKKPTSSQPRKKTDGDDTDLFPDKLEDAGLAVLLATELTLRDVVQAMRHIRAHQFTPVPEAGFSSTRRTALLRHQATMPPLVTAGHVHAILARGGPTRVEREVAELTGRGVLRRVRVERRGAAGEALIETPLLLGMLRDSSSVSAATAEAYVRVLMARPTAQTLGRSALRDEQADELVRAGFLTSAATRTAGPATTLHQRPEDRTTQTSIQRASAAASGSLGAVGGQNALHMAGGSGSGLAGDDEDYYRVAVPGHGRHLKLAEAALGWLRETLGRTRWGEGTEDWLRERFEGGGLYGPRWKELQGAEWTWVLGEAIGLGVVEVFQTGAVGRGVRALGG